MAVGLLTALGGSFSAATTIDSSPTTLTGGNQYNVSDGNTWVVSFFDVDLEYDSTQNQVLNLTFGDNSTGSGWENFTIQIHEDDNGEGGHLFQAYDLWWDGPISSHGFNSGAISGAFDVRVLLQQNLDSTWDITPQYYIPTGSGNAGDGSIGGLDQWHTFFDGSYTSATGFDLTVLETWAQIDPYSSSGEVTVSGSAVAPVPEPASLALLGIGIAGLAGARLRKRRS
jgi:hypothetical protein